MRCVVLSFAIAVLAACNAEAPPADATTPAVPTAPAVTPLPTASRDPATATPATTTPGGSAAPASAPMPAFVDIPWKVSDAAGGQVGTVYTFARDGTFTIDAPGGTPSTGRWTYTGGKLTMTEDGVAYPTDIVSLDDTRFVIRSHNPGGAVDIAMSAVR